MPSDDKTSHYFLLEYHITNFKHGRWKNYM